MRLNANSKLWVLTLKELIMVCCVHLFDVVENVVDVQYRIVIWYKYLGMYSIHNSEKMRYMPIYGGIRNRVYLGRNNPYAEEIH